MLPALPVIVIIVLQSSVKVCTAVKSGHLCMCTVGQHRAEVTLLTVYTREGSQEAEHVEHGCRKCGTGYWHGYYTQVRYFCKVYKLFCVEYESFLIYIQSFSWVLMCLLSRFVQYNNNKTTVGQAFPPLQ